MEIILGLLALYWGAQAVAILIGALEGAGGYVLFFAIIVFGLFAVVQWG